MHTIIHNQRLLQNIVRYKQDSHALSDKRTVSIKRTVWNLLRKSLLNVPYDLYIGKIIE